MASNRLKRYFVMPFFGLLGVILTHSLWMVVRTGGSPVWIGPVIIAGTFLGFFGWMVATGMSRTSSNLPIVLTAAVGGALLSLAAAASGTAPSPLPVAYALLALAGELIYVFWYSRLDRAPSPALRPGEQFPDLVFEDTGGQPFPSAALLGRPTVWLFYRGNWCPLCMAQIQEIAKGYQALAARGTEVVLVSPQSHAQTRALAARFDVPFRFLVDPGAQAARRLGILHKGGVPLGLPGYEPDTVLPTAVVTDGTGRVLWSDETDNYRVRPEPATFLAVLDGTAGISDAGRATPPGTLGNEALGSGSHASQ